MRIRFSLTAILWVAILCVAVEARAQAAGRVTGRVVDATGAALPGVTIDLVVKAYELTSTTDAAGAYGFEDVPAGKAELTYRLLNFSVLRRVVTVTGGAAVRADVALTLSLSADVIVTATSTFRNVADVEDPAANLVGIASAASQGAVTRRPAGGAAGHAGRRGARNRARPGRQPAQRRGQGQPGTTSADSTSITGPTSRRRLPACR